MYKRVLSEVGFRVGRSLRSQRLLRLAANLDPYWIRPGLELSKLGDPSRAGGSVLMALSALRIHATKSGFGDESHRFLALVAEHLPKTRGQRFQDVAALLFSSGKPGYFIEVGTGNGEYLSNSFMLEKYFSWNGILFEPDRRFHKSILSKRSALLETRPAFSLDGEVARFLESSRSGELSTIERYKGDDGRIRRGKINELKTVTLNTVLAEAGAPTEIDYVSIDTEGSEFEVLAGFDLDRWRVRFLSIEHNYVPGKKEELARILAPHGFRVVLEEFSGMDIWLVHSDCS